MDKEEDKGVEKKKTYFCVVPTDLDLLRYSYLLFLTLGVGCLFLLFFNGCIWDELFLHMQVGVPAKHFFQHFSKL